MVVEAGLDQPPLVVGHSLGGVVVTTYAVPYLALQGNDPGPAYETWLKRFIPTAVVEVWPGDGHYPHMVEPVRFAERVRAFADASA